MLSETTKKDGGSRWMCTTSGCTTPSSLGPTKDYVQCKPIRDEDYPGITPSSEVNERTY